MQKMVAIKKFVYRSRDVLPEQEVDVDDEHVVVFEKLGWANLANVRAEAKRRGKYRTRVMRAER